MTWPEARRNSSTRWIWSHGSTPRRWSGTRALGNATAAGALGSWLEREQKRLGVPNAALEELRTLMPSQARYALGTKSGEGKTAKGWNVILPIDVVARRFEGL